ncbi:MAG: hypothetical protein CMB57_04815, partial [Euryarchaeota archaeon]|nr:hypothetical protein [Euryarchaeota archaeon]
DLDLHLVCPSGERIHGGNKKSHCGGELDVDANVRPETKRPVENVVWASRKAPAGNYKVYVHFYNKHKHRITKDRTKYKVVVNVDGEISHYEGAISYGDPIELVCEFTLEDLETRAAKASLAQQRQDAIDRDTVEFIDEINQRLIREGAQPYRLQNNNSSDNEGVSSIDYQIFVEVMNDTQESLAEFGYKLSTNDGCKFTIQKEIKPF